MQTLSLVKVVEQLSQLLLPRNYSVVTAESCTGGMVASAITEFPGISRCFERGFVTYSNLAKQELLGVSAETLEQHGAVSEATAREMAEGALRNSQAQVSLAVTGIAGPTGGGEHKPIGTVCFAWSVLGQETVATTIHFSGDRHSIREQATRYVLERLIDKLAEIPYNPAQSE